MIRPTAAALFAFALFLGCEEQTPPAPAVAPAPAAVPVSAAPTEQAVAPAQPAAQPAPAVPAPAANPAAPLPGLPAPEYSISWGGLRSDPANGDKPLSSEDEIHLLLGRLFEEGGGFVTITHSSGRFLQAKPFEDGYQIEFHDPKTQTHLRRDTVAEIGEVAFVLKAFSEGHNNRPPSRGWVAIK